MIGSTRGDKSPTLVAVILGSHLWQIGQDLNHETQNLHRSIVRLLIFFVHSGSFLFQDLRADQEEVLQHLELQN